MGVTILHQMPIGENRTGPQVIEHLTKRILAMGATQAGHFLVDCETYTSVPAFGQVQRSVHVLHNSEQPASVFAILETPNKQVPLVADGLFDLLMLKLSSVYTCKKQTKMEVKGPRFELVDFVIKLGSVTMNANLKGVLIEIEYRPCLVPSLSWDLLREFLQTFLGSSIPSAPPIYFQNRMDNTYQALDTIQQYLDQFREFRKNVAVR